MYVCMYVCVYVCMYVYIYIWDKQVALIITYTLLGAPYESDMHNIHQKLSLIFKASMLPSPRGIMHLHSLPRLHEARMTLRLVQADHAELHIPIRLQRDDLDQKAGIG